MSHGSSASRFIGRSFLPSWWGDVQLDDGAEEEDERQRPGPKSVGVTQAAACPRVPGWEMMGSWWVNGDITNQLGFMMISVWYWLLYIYNGDIMGILVNQWGFLNLVKTGMWDDHPSWDGMGYPRDEPQPICLIWIVYWKKLINPIPNIFNIWELVPDMW